MTGPLFQGNIRMSPPNLNNSNTVQSVMNFIINQESIVEELKKDFRAGEAFLRWKNVSSREQGMGKVQNKVRSQPPA